MGDFGILTIAYLLGVVIMYAPLTLIHCLSVVVGVNGAFVTVGWRLMTTIALSLLGSASLVLVLEDYGIGAATVVLILLSLFARQHGLRLVRLSQITSPNDDASMHAQTGQLFRTLLLTIALSLACFYAIYLLWHPGRIGSGLLFMTIVEVVVITILFSAVLWLCLRDPLRPVAILILVGCLWPWLSACLLPFLGLLPPSPTGRIFPPGTAGGSFPAGLLVLPLSIPMSTAAFLAMRGRGMRLIWSPNKTEKQETALDIV